MGSEVLLMKPKHQFIFPNGENEFVVPNHYNKGDYYVNKCFLKLVEREAILMNPRHQFIYLNKENEFVVPNH